MYLFAIKALKSSFAEIDSMELGTLAELIYVYDKVYCDAEQKTAFIDDIL